MGNVHLQKEKDEKTETQKIAAILLFFVLFMVLAYSTIISFEIYSFFGAIFLSILTIYGTPHIIKLLTKNTTLTYYSIFLTVTLFLGIKEYRDNYKMMLLLVTHVLMCVGVFLTDNAFIPYLFIFTNFYIVLRIFNFFLNDPQQLLELNNEES